MALQEIIDTAKEKTSTEIWQDVVGWPEFDDLSLNYVITLANDVKHWVIWKALVQRIDYPLKKAIATAKRLDDIDVWRALIQRPDLSKLHIDELIVIAKKSKCYVVHSFIVQHSDLKIHHAMAYAKKFNDYTVWLSLLKRPDAPIDDCIEIAEKYDDSYMWELLAKKFGTELKNKSVTQ